MLKGSLKSIHSTLISSAPFPEATVHTYFLPTSAPPSPAPHPTAQEIYASTSPIKNILLYINDGILSNVKLQQYVSEIMPYIYFIRNSILFYRCTSIYFLSYFLISILLFLSFCCSK